MGKHFYELSAKHIHFISARKLFFVGMLMALVFLTLFSKSASPTSILAYALLLAGGLGNLIDRLIYGAMWWILSISASDQSAPVFSMLPMWWWSLAR